MKSPMRFVALLCLTIAGIGATLAQERTILRVHSATDTAAFAKVIERFQQLNPEIEIQYREFNTRELYEHIANGAREADIVISSAMDLQVDLVNQGFAHRFNTDMVRDLPKWSNWLDSLYGFTYEPAAMVYNRAAFENLGLPDTRSALATTIRDHQAIFEGRIGTYDIEQSGVGYLFATQDSQRGYLFSRLMETFGRANADVFCCTSEMVSRISTGELLVGYNILGSYAFDAVAQDERIGIKLFADYALVMTRTAFVMRTSKHKPEATAFIAFLLSHEGQQTIAQNSALIPLREDARTPAVNEMLGSSRALLPIRLGPNLLTYLDEMKKQRFLDEWRAALKTNLD